MVPITNSLDPDPEQDLDSDFWLDPDPDSMNMDPKHCFLLDFFSVMINFNSADNFEIYQYLPIMDFCISNKKESDLSRVRYGSLCLF